MPDAPEPMAATTSIAEVAIFSDWATVTRRAEGRVEAGPTRLAIDGLPPAVDPSTVRVSLRGQGVRLRGSDVSVVAGEPGPVHEELRAARAVCEAAEDDEAVAAQRVAFCEQVLQTSGEFLGRRIGRDSAGLAEARQVERELVGQLGDARRQRREAGERLAQARHRRTLVEAAHDGESDAARENTRVTVDLEAAQATPIELTLRYDTTGVWWSPVYDVTLLPDALEVTAYAEIFQRTGEDWPAVPLVLSTARVRAGGTVPEAAPWYLHVGPEQDLMVRGYSGPPMPMAAVPAGAVLPVAPEEEIVPEERGGAAVFRTPDPVAVPSDGSTHRAKLTTTRLAARFDHVVAPRLSEDVVRRATVTNTSPILLLAGPASVYDGGDLVVKTRLPRAATGEEIELALGAEDRIVVERQLADREANRRRVLRSGRTSLAYRTTVANHRPDPAQVEVREQEAQGRGQVRDVATSTDPPAGRGPKAGDLVWHLVLAPGEQRELWLRVQMDLPAEGAVLTGL